MTRTVAFIQARMSSSRLPGKVLEPLHGEPMIAFMARRAARARRLDRLVVVTSTDPSDDLLADAVAGASLPVFRGALNDVLQRYVDAARSYAADEVVRLTGDCPLIDPAVIDAVIEARRRGAADYTSNVDPPTFPDGLDVECFTREALERAARHAEQPAEREHVTLWMRSEAAGLRRENVRALADLSHVRLTVDYRDDLELVRRIVASLAKPHDADLFDILRVLAAEPALLAINRHDRNEGLGRSLGAAANHPPAGADS